MSKQIVVIGGDAAGMTCASKVKREHPDWNVTVLERGEHVSYAACGIPYFVSGVVPELESLQLITPEQFRKERDIDVRMGWEAVQILPDEYQIKTKKLDSGEEFVLDYDQLMIATGASAVIPPIDGSELDGVFTVRNLTDARNMRRWLTEHQPENAVIVGGGYIGLEMAEALVERNIKVQVVEMLPQLLSPMDKPITERVMEELKKNGVEVHLESKVEKLRGVDGAVARVMIEGMTNELPADMVILGSGIRPNSALAEEAGLEVGNSGGILVDDRQQTSHKDIFAGGDCVEQKHLVTGGPTYVPLGPAANKHGRVAGINISGGKAVFPGIVGTAVMKVFGLTISRTGLMESQAKGSGFKFFGNTIKSRERAGYYPNSGQLIIHVVAEQGTGRLLGAEICGGTTAAKRIDPFAVALYNEMTLDEIAMLDLSYAPPYSPVLDPVGVAAQVAAGKMSSK